MRIFTKLSIYCAFLSCAGLIGASAQGPSVPSSNSADFAAGASASPAQPFQTAASAGSSSSPFQTGELSVQVSGVWNARIGGANQHLATNSAGLLVGYRAHLSRWEAVEIEYGYTRDGQRYYPGSGAYPAAYGVQSSMHDLLANEVVTTPHIFGVFEPFVLLGGGGALFHPNGEIPGPAASTQLKAVIDYGFGVDFHVYHAGARLEYQALNFRVPNFNNPALSVPRWTMTNQPSAGLVFTF